MWRSMDIRYLFWWGGNLSYCWVWYKVLKVIIVFIGFWDYMGIVKGSSISSRWRRLEEVVVVEKEECVVFDW